MPPPVSDQNQELRTEPGHTDVPVFDAAVVGGGSTGLATALRLTRAVPDARIALVAEVADPNGGDWRTAALFHDSIDLLRAAGAGDDLLANAASLAGIRMVDISDRLVRAPDVLFRAQELGLESFGYNIANTDIVACLEGVVAEDNRPTRFDSRLTGMEPGFNAATLRLEDGRALNTRVVIAADGRRSLARAEAGIATRAWDHDQTAMTTHFAHTRGHGNISTELHGDGGPCTTVPLPGINSSLVWMEPTRVAERLLADSTPEFAGPTFRTALARRVAGFLGPPGTMRPPRAIPLASLVAKSFARGRVLLVGEAAHAFPPIGAQGLNLGFRDVADAVDLVADALREGSDPGGERILSAYHRRRYLDVEARSQGVDLLNRSLTSELPLLPLARGAGLHALRAVPALRRLAMRQGMAGLPALPVLAVRGSRAGA